MKKSNKWYLRRYPNNELELFRRESEYAYPAEPCWWERILEYIHKLKRRTR